MFWSVVEGHSNAALVSVIGLWIGLTICVLVQSIFFVTFVFKLDWKKAAEEVRAFLL